MKKKMNNYLKIIKNYFIKYYLENKKLLIYHAKNALFKVPCAPLEIDDLINVTLINLYNERIDLEIFLQNDDPLNFATFKLYLNRKIKYCMLKYCKIFKNKEHNYFWNNSVNLNDDDDTYNNENYSTGWSENLVDFDSQNLFTFLEDREIEFLFLRFVKKWKKTQLSDYFHMSIFKINLLIKKIRNKFIENGYCNEYLKKLK